jgi:putative transposase
MARAKHTHVPGGIYLVSAVGERGQPIFVSDSDRVALSDLVAQVIARCGAQVHAFSWLENEILMVVQVYDVSLSGVMQRISSLHARKVNGKLGYKGHLFHHPHRATWLGDSVSVLEGIVTVHLSSVRLNLTGDPALYPWSSHRAYLGLEEVHWLTTQMVLGLLSSMPAGQLVTYTALMDRQEAWMHALHLQPWKSPGSLESRLCRPYDEFHAWLKNRSLEDAKPASLDQLIQAIARWFQVDPAAIESNPGTPLLLLARGLIVWFAMHNGIASLSQLGRRFDRGRSTLYDAPETYRTRAPQLFALRLTEILEGPAIPVSEVLRMIGAGPEKSSRRRK